MPCCIKTKLSTSQGKAKFEGISHNILTHDSPNTPEKKKAENID